MKNIQAQMKELFGNSCYAYCIAALFRKTADIKVLTKYVLEGWYNGYIEDDGYVAKPLQFIKLVCGETYKDVQHVPYEPLDKEQIVCWEFNGGTHFVIMKDNQVVFDPSGDSNSVKYGKPKNARLFIK
jgi:hypothetical protein